jgi:hypothetical protein
MSFMEPPCERDCGNDNSGDGAAFSWQTVRASGDVAATLSAGPATGQVV